MLFLIITVAVNCFSNDTAALLPVDLCFYHSANKLKKATIKTIAAIREHYTTSTYILTSGNGHNYTNVARAFRAHYTHYYTSSGGTQSPMDHHTAVHFVDRFRNAALQCPSPWIMMVEDDVYCRKASTILPQFDGNGLAWNNKPLSDEFFQFIKNKTGKMPYISPDFQYGLCGGAVFRTEVMRNLRVTEEELQLWSTFDNRIAIASDILFTTVLLVNNHTVGPWDDLMQKGSRNTDAAFQHSVKTWYGTALDSHENELFEPKY